MRTTFHLVSLAAAIMSTLGEAPGRQTPVEVMIPKPPQPVLVEGHRVLAYELHITNFGLAPLLLRSVEVFSRLDAQQPALTLRDSALSAAYQAVGHPMMGAMTTGASRLDPGSRGVVFVWLSLDTAAAPAMLRHRLTFAILDSAGVAGNTPSVIDSLATKVEQERVLVVVPPFRGGDWLAGEGPSNSSSHRRSIIPLNGKAWLSQRFAIDWVKIGPNGNTFHGDRSRNENFWGFGEPVRAVADGDVAAVLDSLPDNAPDHLPAVSIATIAGNYVIMRLGPSRYALFAHLKHGSVVAHVGEHVRRGAVIALLGNTGQATGPHMHFQLMDRPSPVAAEGIPFVFDRYISLGSGQDYEPNRHITVPRRNEMPGEDEVVQLPKE